MGEFISGILNTSIISGTGIAVVSVLFMFIGKGYSAKCRKTVWLLLALSLLIPFRLIAVSGAYTAEIPNAVMNETGSKIRHAENYALQDHVGQIAPDGMMWAQPLLNVPEKEVTVADILFIVWACVGVVMAVYFTMGYWVMRRKIKRWSHACEDVGIQREFAEASGMYGMKRIPELRMLQDSATGPFTTGVLRNIIVLPDEIENDKHMRFIIKHEMVHCKNRDILWKLLFLFVNIVHWFNPLVWILRMAAERDMEIACDEEVMRFATREERKDYSNVIMSWVERSRYKGSVVSTGYAQEVRFLKRRFYSILNGGGRKKGILLTGAVCAFVMFMGSMIRITVQQDSVGTQALLPETTKIMSEIEGDISQKLSGHAIALLPGDDQVQNETSGTVDETMQELEELMADFSQAYFAGDIDAIGNYLADGYEWDIDVYESPGQADELEMIQIKGFQQTNERHPAGRYILSLEFRIPDEDSLTYLAATWIRENGSWKISGYGVEK